MRTPAPVHPVVSKNPILFRERLEWGVTRGRLRASDVVRPYHGVVVLGRMPDGVRERVEAFTPLLRDTDAFSHSTAALLFDAQLPRDLQQDTRVHVTSLAGAERFRRRGVIGHRAEELPRVQLGLVPVIDPAHVWLQLATMLDHGDLVAVGDRWVTAQRDGAARRPPVTTLDELHAVVGAAAGGRGVARARAALRAVRVGPESRMETQLRLLLVRSGLPEPLVNPPVHIEGRDYHPDLAYPDERVVIEYQGEEHRSDPRRWRDDMRRRERFESAGHRVIEAHAGDVFAEPEAFLARVCHVLAQRRRAFHIP